MTPPLLSLCLATYNRARYLDRYLTHHLTALDAAGIDYELVVSDNCSTDETPEILARYAARHPRMRVSRQPRNVGAYPNILTTLHQARGEVVVSIADDDLALTDTLLAYVQHFVDDPALVMVQAPWVLIDETQDNAVVGQFYDFDGERRFARNDFASCLVFLIEHHVFPECWLIRRSALTGIVGATPRFAYSYFCMLAHALTQGDVLFSPQPHIAATSISEGSGTHVGAGEALESWDVYRGGLEWLASYARQFSPGVLTDPVALGGAIQDFVIERMGVAARLHAHAGAWSNAYQLLRRMDAYGHAPEIDFAPNDVAVLAAVETALLECVQLGAAQVVAPPGLPENVLASIKPVDGIGFIRPDALREDETRRAWCVIGAAPDAALRPQDFAFDLVPAMARFPLFPAA